MNQTRKPNGTQLELVEKERNSRERKESPAPGDPYSNSRKHRGLGSIAGIQGSDGPLEKGLLAGGGGNGKAPRTEGNGRIDGILDGRVPEHVNAGERTDGRKRKTPCDPVTQQNHKVTKEWRPGDEDKWEVWDLLFMNQYTDKELETPEEVLDVWMENYALNHLT